jgi:hypothetical protein
MALADTPEQAVQLLRKKFAGLLKPGALFLVFCMPRKAVRAPFGGPADGRRRYPTPARTHLAQRRIWPMRTTYDFAPLWRSTIGFDRYSTSSMPRSTAVRRTIIHRATSNA